MAGPGVDPYRTLGVDPGAPDAELRAAYRRQVQLHHPDHNGGTPESARRFEAVQEAYAQIRVMRAAAGRGTPSGGRTASARRTASGPAPRRSGAADTPDPAVEARLADLERELREAQRIRDQARAAARRAAAEPADRPADQRPSDEELGYISTEDSFSKILADAASELSGRLADASREHPVPKRLSDLIDELGSKLGGDPPAH